MSRTCGHSAGPSIRAAQGLHGSSSKWTEHLPDSLANTTSQENQSCYRLYVQGLRQTLEHRSEWSTAASNPPPPVCAQKTKAVTVPLATSPASLEAADALASGILQMTHQPPSRRHSRSVWTIQTLPQLGFCTHTAQTSAPLVVTASFSADLEMTSPRE